MSANLQAHPVMKATIVGHDWVGDHVEYIICVFCADSSGRWKSQSQVQKRYSDIRKFDSNVRVWWRQHVGEKPASFPGFPPRRPFSSSSSSFIRARLAALQAYLSELLERDNEELTAKVSNFLGVPPPPLISVQSLAQENAFLGLAGRYSNTKVLEDDISIGSKVVGVGLSGGVRLATRKGDGTTCAVKSLSKHGRSKASIAKLRSEVEVFLSLDHPHVARLEHVFETTDAVHLVMEYLQGGELYDRISTKGRLPETEAANIARQVLLSIAYVHAQGAVHGDIKPENYLFEDERSDHLKLIDFGMALWWDGRSNINITGGTMLYVAPEVLQRSWTDKADMWSAGVLIFSALCGCHPWYGSNKEVQRQVQLGKPYYHPSRWNPLSAGAKDFVQQLLRYDASQRPSASMALNHYWLLEENKQHHVMLEPAIVKSFSSFSGCSPMRRLCLRMLAWSLPRQALGDLRQVFQSLDQDNDGVIGFEEFSAAMRSAGMTVSSDILGTFSGLDMNKDGGISYSEFLAAAAHDGQNLVTEDVLRLAFARFDVTPSGHLSAEGLTDLVGNAPFEGRTARALIEEVVGDGRATVTFAELKKYLRCDGLSEAACKMATQCPGFNDADKPDDNKPHQSLEDVVEVSGSRTSTSSGGSAYAMSSQSTSVDSVEGSRNPSKQSVQRLQKTNWHSLISDLAFKGSAHTFTPLPMY